MDRFLLYIAAGLLLATACAARGSPQRNADAPGGASNVSTQRVDVQVSGERTAAISDTTGKEGVKVETLSSGKTMVTISATSRDADGRDTTVFAIIDTPSMAKLALHPARVEGAIGMVIFAQGDDHLEFSTIAYPMLNATDPPGGGVVTFDTVTKISHEKDASLYHLVGSFHFSAGTVPDLTTPICKAKAEKAFETNTLVYEAFMCGSRQVEVHGHFDSEAYVLEM